MTPEAEKFNGWMAMIGFVAATGAYITTGQIIRYILMNPSQALDLVVRANGRFTMVAFWIGLAVYTKVTYFS